MFAHLSRNVRKHLMLGVLQFDAEHCIRQSLEDLRHDLYSLFLRHILLDGNFWLADKLRIVTWPQNFAKPRCAYQLQAARLASRGLSLPTRVNTSGPCSVMAIVCST